MLSDIGLSLQTFNRTSMESKRSIALRLEMLACTLLIEPVWNRNWFPRWEVWTASKDGILLIEPVWNRNNSDVIYGGQSQVLLIEPVWNRNVIPGETVAGVRSLLIEPVWNRNYEVNWSLFTGDILLIEPVWNRNLSVGKVLESRTTF